MSLFIVGAQKAGTTALLRLLDQHPDLYRHPYEEMTYFVRDSEYSRGARWAHQRYFSTAPEGAHLLAKNVDVLPDPRAQGRLAEHSPGAHVLCVLRNPVDRAFSSFLLARSIGAETQRSFANALRDHGYSSTDGWPSHGNYLANGEYIAQVESLHRTFPADHVHILYFDDLVADPACVASSVLHRVGLPEASFHPPKQNPSRSIRSTAVARLVATRTAHLPPHRRPKWSRVLNALNAHSAPPQAMDPEIRASLRRHFEPHDAALSRYLGHPLPWRG